MTRLTRRRRVEKSPKNDVVETVACNVFVVLYRNKKRISLHCDRVNGTLYKIVDKIAGIGRTDMKFP